MYGTRHFKAACYTALYDDADKTAFRKAWHIDRSWEFMNRKRKIVKSFSSSSTDAGFW